MARDLVDTSRFTLWHGTYRAQIRDFSSIRDGDVVLLRNLDETDDNGEGALDEEKLSDHDLNRSSILMAGSDGQKEGMEDEDSKVGGAGATPGTTHRAARHRSSRPAWWRSCGASASPTTPTPSARATVHTRHCYSSVAEGHEWR